MATKTKKSKCIKSTKRKEAAIIKQNIGIDISKDDFKSCIYQLFSNQDSRIKSSRTFKNNAKGFVTFLTWIKSKCIKTLEIRVTLEATGVYYEQLTYFLDDNDIYVSVILPNKSKAYAQSLNLKSKTDEIDAQMLGQMGLERNLSRWKAISPKMRRLKQLTRERVTIVEEKTALLNKLHALKSGHQPNSDIIERLGQRITMLKKQIKEVEKEVKNVIKNDTVLTKHVDNISTVKGLGAITIATIIAETDGFNLFTSRKQLVSYAGYDVVQRQSGSSINGKTKISKKGNRFIRRALHFPAIVAVKYNEQLNQFYKRIEERTAIKMKGYVAVQRKLLLLIYALFKNEVPFDPDFYKKHGSESSN